MLVNLQRVIDGAEAARNLADSYRLLNQVPIRLGVMSTIGHLRLARFVAQFEKEHVGVELSVSERSIEDLKADLDAGDLDVAILNPMDGLGDALHYQELYRERYVVIFPPDHHLEGAMRYV